MSTHPAKQRSPRGRRKAAPDPPGEVPADLRAKGWELREHVNERGDYRMVNPVMDWETKPCATPRLAFEAARAVQKNTKHKGKAAAEVQPDERFAKGAVPPGAEKFAVTRSFMSPLGVALTPEQLAAKCDELDAALSEKESLERRFDEVRESFKADIKEAEGRVAEVEHVLRRRADEREVPCEERLYDSAKLVCVVRLDTGVIVEQRPMKPEEAQRPLLKL